MKYSATFKGATRSLKISCSENEYVLDKSGPLVSREITVLLRQSLPVRLAKTRVKVMG